MRGKLIVIFAMLVVLISIMIVPSGTASAGDPLGCNVPGVEMIWSPMGYGINASVNWTVPEGAIAEQNSRKIGPGGIVKPGPSSYWGSTCPCAGSVPACPAAVAQPAPAPPPIVVETPCPTIPQPTVDSCDPAVRSDRDPVPGQPWSIPAGTWRILNGWSNWPGQNQAPFKMLLPPNVSIALNGGGSLFARPPECEDATRDEFFNRNPLPELALDQMVARQLGVVTAW